MRTGRVRCSVCARIRGWVLAVAAQQPREPDRWQALLEPLIAEDPTLDADAIASEQAGFRACKRCEPQKQEPRASLIADLCRFIEANRERRITLEAEIEQLKAKKGEMPAGQYEEELERLAIELATISAQIRTTK
mgnify:CR=1 FL=1